MRTSTHRTSTYGRERVISERTGEGRIVSETEGKKRLIGINEMESVVKEERVHEGQTRIVSEVELERVRQS